MKPNPFAQQPPQPKPMLSFDEMLSKLNPEPVEAITAPQEESQSTFAQNFLGELRDFMNDFAETDLNVESIEEPGDMTKAQANFYIKLYNELLNEEAEMNQLCDDEIRRNTEAINLFRKQRQDELDRKKFYFQSILKEFAAKELDGKKTKTVKLPYGNLSFKKQQPKFIYEDEDELKNIIRHIDPELIEIKTVEKVDKTKMKKLGEIKDGKFFLGGEEISSVKIEVLDDKFEIK